MEQEKNPHFFVSYVALRHTLLCALSQIVVCSTAAVVCSTSDWTSVKQTGGDRVKQMKTLTSSVPRYGTEPFPPAMLNPRPHPIRFKVTVIV